ncbi:hypothetical protein MRB53_020457 [Persea americana]|uniref:Uncharacterized protein n=1 Tax=Persea americana TaxID=3435 RepID=A0ACC2L137_PERAE|nr:hypothetical protein MRB53_020457 [Persea americana]
MILDHPAVSGFVTHCGWNSVTEGVASGVPMLTWPVYSYEFYDEKLITRVLKIGVEVGSRVSNFESRPVIGKEEIQRAAAQLMDDGDESNEMRKRAKELWEVAKRSVEKGGHLNYLDLDRLIEDLKDVREKTQRHGG